MRERNRQGKFRDGNRRGSRYGKNGRKTYGKKTLQYNGGRNPKEDQERDGKLGGPVV